MGACACVIIGVGKHRRMYSIRGVLEWRKYTDMYNCVGSMILGSSVGFFIGVSIGDSTGWEE